MLNLHTKRVTLVLPREPHVSGVKASRQPAVYTHRSAQAPVHTALSDQGRRGPKDRASKLSTWTGLRNSPFTWSFSEVEIILLRRVFSLVCVLQRFVEAKLEASKPSFTFTGHENHRNVLTPDPNLKTRKRPARTRLRSGAEWWGEGGGRGGAAYLHGTDGPGISPCGSLGVGG